MYDIRPMALLNKHRRTHTSTYKNVWTSYTHKSLQIYQSLIIIFAWHNGIRRTVDMVEKSHSVRRPVTSGAIFTSSKPRQAQRPLVVTGRTNGPIFLVPRPC